MHRRLPPAALVAVALLLAVTACTPPPDPPGEATETADSVAAAGADEWTDHFEERAAQLESPSGTSWGGFGPEGGVAPVGFTTGSVPPGDHAVTVECAAATTFVVDVALSQAESVPGADGTHELTCPGAATYPFTTDAEGLSVGLDSRGESGAYLIAIDVVP